MKMAKPSANDKEAAYDLLALLTSISRTGPLELEAPSNLLTLLETEGTLFDPNDDVHLAAFYNHIITLLDKAPGFHGRVIGGMCAVIMNEANQILDPTDDAIALHPRFSQLSSNLSAAEALIEELQKKNQQLVESARAPIETLGGWERCLKNAWPQDAQNTSAEWEIGSIDEDDNHYPLITVDAAQYDQEGESEKIANALIALWQNAFSIHAKEPIVEVRL